MDRRGFLKGAGQLTVAGAVAAAMHPARALIGMLGGSPGSPAAGIPLTLNLYGIADYASEQPFLNAFKQTGFLYSKNPWCAWGTYDGSGADTNEEGYLSQVLDADGYASTLTLSTPPSGGQKFTQIAVSVLASVSPPPGVGYYPADTYRLQGQGKCTLVISKDGTGWSNASAGCTISGTTFTSSNAWGTTWEVTITGAGAGGKLIPSSAGIGISITALPDSANYFKAATLVQTSYISQFDGGQIFHPNFLAWMENTSGAHFYALRFMDWQQTNNNVQGGPYGGIYFSKLPQATDTSATLAYSVFTASISGTTLDVTAILTTPQSPLGIGSVINVPGGTNTTITALGTGTGGTGTYTVANSQTVASESMYVPYTWQGPSGTRTITLKNSTAQDIQATFATGSGSVTFSTAVSSNCTDYYLCLFTQDSWAQRPLPSNFSWGCIQGVPLEICFALATILNADPWVNIPERYSSSDWISFATFCQSNLQAGRRVRPEFSNETWNTGQSARAVFIQNKSAVLLGGVNAAQYTGVQTALIADAFNTVFGAAFDTDVLISMPGQAASTAVVTNALSTPNWTGNTPPYQRQTGRGTYTINAVHIAPYFGNGNIVSADFTELQAQVDGGYTMFFDSWQQNPVNGYSFTGYSGALPSGGWFALCNGFVTSHVSALTAYRNLPIDCYEGGWQFEGESNATQSTFLATAARDARTEDLFNTFYRGLVSSGCRSVAQFNDCGSYTQAPTTEWGAIESTLQNPASPPPRWKGMVDAMT